MTDIAVHAEGRFAGHGGLDLFRQSWRPAGTPRAVVVNLHGLGDHSSLYPTLVDHLVGREMVVQAFDLRGNGRSPGARGHVQDWRSYREDLATFLDLVRRDDPGRPLFLLGNSLGGLIVLDYALHTPAGISGVIAVSAPLSRLNVPVPLMALGRLMSKVWPGFSLETGLDLSGIARDPSVAEAIVSDSLFHRRGSARLSTEVTTAITRVRAGAGAFALPVLLIHGAQDRMVSPEGSRAFAAEVASPDKQLIEYPEGYHALFADFGHERVLADVTGWIEARL
jgi:alpha-beta hydrolase superfamily lysophospholipase